MDADQRSGRIPRPRPSDPLAYDAPPAGPQRPAGPRVHTSPARLPSLTGLRFAAAGGVVYTHVALLLHPRLATRFGPEVWVGTSSASLFFILSGYVLTYSARETDTAVAFWRRRAAKILPNHLITWSAAVAGAACAGAATVTSVRGATAAVANLFLVNAWIPSRRFVFAGNPVAWSLAAEVLFYLLFPLLLPKIQRLTRRGLMAGGVAAVGAVWMWPVLCRLLIGPSGSGFTGSWFVDVLPVARLPEFLLGMIAARLSATGVRLPGAGALSAGLLTVVTVVIDDRCLSHPFMYAAATIGPLVTLVYATAELDLHGRASLLRLRPVVFLGEISYAMCVVHAPVLLAVYAWLTGSGWSGPAAVLVVLPLVVLVSWLLYVTVERPWARLPAAPPRGDRDLEAG